MRTTRTSIAATVLVISVVTAARAAPRDCTSIHLSAMELTGCFPGLVDTRPVDTVKRVGMLGNAYAAYIDIKQCHEAPFGLGLYVSDQEVEWARKAVGRIEQAVKPHLDPATFDGLWSRVEATKRNRVIDRIVELRNDNSGARIACTWRYEDLLKVLREQVPDSGRIVKGF